jgi:glycosyltransferase involved in cell wall biosynthesis
MRAKLGLAADDTAVVIVSNFARWKRIETFIKAAARLREQPNIKFFIVGSPLDTGQYYDEMRSLAAAQRASVNFLGYCDHPADYLAASDIAALCSDGEGFSVALLEAMVSALPVVVSNSNVCPELVVDGETGLLFPVGDDGALAAHILALARDPDTRTRLGDAGRARVVAKFTVAQQAAAIAHIYADVAKVGGHTLVERGLILGCAFLREAKRSVPGLRSIQLRPVISPARAPGARARQ